MSGSSRQAQGGEPSGGVMRRLAAGAKGGGFAGAFQFVDALFSPSKTAAYVERQQARRRRVAVPAPGDPPSQAEDEILDGPASDDPAALPVDLLGPVLEGPPQVPPWGAPGLPSGPSAAAPGGPSAGAPSARGEQEPGMVE